MDKLNRAIVLDMDSTLEYGETKVGLSEDTNNLFMTLRPNINPLIEKLKEAKNQNIDVILCTTASEPWVKTFLKVEPRFKEIFDKIYHSDNEQEWKRNNEEGKPVTTFGYDSILFIDDNTQEEDRLRKIFNNEEIDKHVTYFSGFGFYTDTYKIYELKKLSEKDADIANRFKKYIELLRDEPGCLFMCSAIDDFMNKDIETGIISIDYKYEEENKEYNEKVKILNNELQMKLREINEEKRNDFMDINENMKKYMDTDKKYPYEGIENIDIDADKRIELNQLVEEAKKVRGELNQVRRDENQDKRQSEI